MKIVQITDLHVADEGVGTNGVDVRQNFQAVLKTTRSLAPDLIVLTGDLCYDVGEERTYRWIRSHLDFLKIPYTAIGGNHDSSSMLAKAFHIDHLLVGNELFYRRELEGWNVLFLETSVGELSEKQLLWLEIELSKIGRDAVIFMHHPPIISGVPFMDNKHALRNMAEVQAVLFNFPHHLSIFCGHYHVEKVVCQRNLTVHITPSVFFQIDWHAEGFKVDHHRIGLREINLRNDGVVESTVIYQQGHKK
ncbi:MAG TPA: metallophosphoesterase [Bacteroidetes bacterium]|nr:metallophosphoesterase [Bacteroidota bacterium]